MTMQTTGFGSARKPKKTAPVDRYCISPQLAPPLVTPASKKMFARSEDYHEGGGYGGGKRK